MNNYEFKIMLAFLFFSNFFTGGLLKFCNMKNLPASEIPLQKSIFVQLQPPALEIETQKGGKYYI